MTADEKRIAIATEMGWKFDHRNKPPSQWAELVVIISPEGKETWGWNPSTCNHKAKKRQDDHAAGQRQEINKGLSRAGVPDYLNSRDAIVGAILRRFRTREEKAKFACELWELLFDAFTEQNQEQMEFLLATATAEQLGDAFLGAL